MPRLPGVSDLIAVLQAQTEALAALPGILVALNRSLRTFADTANQARDTALAVQRVTARLDGLVTELEQPVRMMVPGMQRLAALMENPLVDEVPDALRRVQHELLPILTGILDSQATIAGIAASTDGIKKFVEDMGGRMVGISGAAARGMRWLSLTGSAALRSASPVPLSRRGCA